MSTPVEYAPPKAPSVSAPRRRTGDEGQSVVEAAIVLPAMTFLVLGVIQLTMIQHARIMTDYAAYCAARAGIVYNADPDAMKHAATIALLPTMTRTDDLSAVVVNGARTLVTEGIERAISTVPIVEITTLSPRAADFTPALTQHLGGREIDFDDIRTAAANANQLQIELRYYYKMRIPFANQMLQTLFFAQVGRGNLIRWMGTRSADMTRPEIFGGDPHVAARASYAGYAGDPHAGAVAVASFANRFYFPLKATYTMRMQSNVFRANAGP